MPTGADDIGTGHPGGSTSGREPDGSCGDIDVSIAESGEAVVIASGEIDPSNADQLVEALGGAAGKDLVVDLTKVTFMDSSGVAALVRMKELAPGAVSFVVEPGSQVDRLLDLVGIKEYLGLMGRP